VYTGKEVLPYAEIQQKVVLALGKAEKYLRQKSTRDE
jgi:hypothetical protein